MNLDLVNKHIVIPGGLGGIGSKTVELLLKEGSKVTVLTQSSLPNISNTEDFNIVKTKYNDQNILSKDLKKINNQSKIDGIIIMIGSGRSDKDIFLNENESKRIWNINYFFPRQIAEAFVSIALETEEESKIPSNLFITFCSSIAAQTFLNAPTEYSVSKSALEKLTKELSWKLGPLFRVNCISPGNIFFKGGTWDKIKNSGEINIEKMLEENVPLKKFGSPLDIASFAVFLSSYKVASFFNGACIKIDGGQTKSL